jgi:two-component system, OmpR family, alkaline phosphatase synthesis response regulator PhoP
MQGTEKLTKEDEDLALMLDGIDPDEAYCSTTNRIVIISALPRHVHGLIRELSDSCYDVMVFHYADPALMLQLKPDLLIADLTLPDDSGDKSWVSAIEGLGSRILRLVKPGTVMPAASGHILEWPSPTSEALQLVRSLMGEGRPSPSVRDTDGASNGVLQLKDLTLDLRRYMVQAGGSRIELTKTEFDLLKAILEAGGAVLSRQELMDEVWGEGYFGGSNIVDVHVKSLRQKLGDDPRKPRYVATVRGIGYRAADDQSL